MSQETPGEHPTVLIPMYVFTDPKLTKRTQPVLAALYSLADSLGRVVTTREQLSERSKVSRLKDVSKATSELEKLGWLTKARKAFKGALTYKLTVPERLSRNDLGATTGATGAPNSEGTLQTLPVGATGAPNSEGIPRPEHIRARARFNYRGKTTKPKPPKPNFEQDINTAERLLGMDSLPGEKLSHKEAQGLENYPEARANNVIDLSPHSPWQGKIRGES